jgi:peptidoglycan/xylan/chitin deacetylase (PgdA/CDA1 family)
VSADHTLVRKLIKSAALPAGLAGRRRPGDVVILLYHRVGAGTGEISLPVDVFERHLETLAQRERLLTLQTALGPNAGGGVVVSIDDGYRDFFDHVVPRLVRYRIPAILYLATGLVANGAGSPADAITWSQLAESLDTGLVTIGAHTHSHRALSSVSEQVAEDEMRRSKDLIEDHLGIACRHFAYPFAVGSPAADRAARRLFASAALDAWKVNRAHRIEPHRLGRVPVLRSDGRIFFRAKVGGALDTEAIAYRLAGRGPWGRP